VATAEDRHEFRFVVTNVSLEPDQIEKIGRAIVQAGTLAVADLTPEEAVNFQVRPGIWWRGLPPVEIVEGLKEFGAKQVGAQ
jgi:hypothetical protein